jgi:hypothetical protein
MNGLHMHGNLLILIIQTDVKFFRNDKANVYTQIMQSHKESQHNLFSLDHVYIGLALNNFTV